MKTFFAIVCTLVLSSQQVKAQVPDWQWAIQSNGYRVGDAQPAGMCIDPHGNIYILAFFDSTVSIGDSVFHADSLQGYSTIRGILIIKYNSDGKILWINHPEGTTEFGTGGIALDSSGNCYLGAYTSSDVDFGNGMISGFGDFIAKLDVNGNALWVKQLNRNGSFRITALATDRLNNVYALAFCSSLSWSSVSPVYSTVDSVTFNKDSAVGSILAKFGSDGNLFWATQPLTCKPFPTGSAKYDNDLEAFAISVSGDIDNVEIYIVGGVTADTVFFGNNFITVNLNDTIPINFSYIARINSGGECLWVKSSNPDHFASSLCPIGGFIYICGCSPWGGGIDGYDFITKYDRFGTQYWTKEIFLSPESHLFNSYINLTDNNICGDLLGSLYFSGNFRDSLNINGNTIKSSGIGIWDEFVIKYDKDGNVAWIKQSKSNAGGVVPGGLYFNAFINPGWEAFYNGDLYITGSFEESVNFGTSHLVRDDGGAKKDNLFLTKLSDVTSSVKSTTNISDNQLNIYPNPASSEMTISYTLSKTVQVSLEIYDLLGNLKKHISLGEISGGDHSPTVDLHDFQSGAYLCKIFNGENTSSGMFTVVK